MTWAYDMTFFHFSQRLINKTFNEYLYKLLVLKTQDEKTVNRIN